LFKTQSDVPPLFLLFNQRVTAAQDKAARQQLGVAHIIPLPPELQPIWSQIPPELPALATYLEPVRIWLASPARPDPVHPEGTSRPGARRVLAMTTLQYIGQKKTSTMCRLPSFCPETALFRNFCVNLQVCWFGERMFASAQPFDFLDLAENISFPDQKLQ
jgi:hypothetical protein